ncbi:hypothetical protein [Nocardia goodfellowii]|uniref:Membrane protein n=1 Tax=Nocardia goodfellowii TaxID=882446 RepID=A0ABS4QEI4_9NOCA|nr:hypothetical protein [Nocardia goodfellowii]MBP2190116.1 putative membrane protein [Nocardia goodfellowii]
MTSSGFDPQQPHDPNERRYEEYPAQGGQEYAQGPGAGMGYGEPVRFSASNAVSFAWRRFKANPVPWVGVTVLFGILLGVATGTTGGFDSDVETAGVLTVSAVLAWLLTTLFWNVFTQAALAEVAGERPGLVRFTTLKNFGQFFLAAVVIGILGVLAQVFFGIGGVVFAILGVLCGIASIVVAFLLQWTYMFIIDRNLRAADAIRASAAAIRADLGPILLLTITLAALNVLGAIPCGLGLLVTIPLSVIASAWAYRTLTGGAATAP